MAIHDVGVTLLVLKINDRFGSSNSKFYANDADKTADIAKNNI